MRKKVCILLPINKCRHTGHGNIPTHYCKTESKDINNFFYLLLLNELSRLLWSGLFH